MISTWGATGGLKPAMSLNLLSGAISSLVTFSRSSVATVTDFEGVIKNTKINEARFDGMRRVENLLTYSQDFSNVAWAKSNSTITTGITSPDGTLAQKLVVSTASSDHNVFSFPLSLTVSNTYTYSVYVKKAEYSSIWLRLLDGGGAGTVASTFFDINTGSVLSTTNGTASISPANNGWYRCTITGISLNGGTAVSYIYATQGTTFSYTGDGISGIYLWGAQLELVQGQTNQNPSEYISKNVLSYPYQGAGVDGVQYFNYTNPNCAINGVLTQIPTTPINSSNSKWAYNCQSAGDYFSTPSSTANRITGNLSLLAQVALDNWTPSTVQCLIVKDGVSAGTRSWAFNVQSSGVPRLNISLDGTNLLSYNATVATGFTDRTVHYVGVQREASTGIIRFYTSEDGRTFTQLGADVASTAGSLYDATTQPVQFGNLSSLNFALDGKIYDSHVYSGLKFTGTSTMVMDFDPSNWTVGQGNLLTYSQDFSNAAWIPSTATVTTNTATAPDGTITADSIAFTSSAGYVIQQYNTTTPLTAYTFSVYLKADSPVSVIVTIQQSGGGVANNTVNVTTSWQRFNVSYTTDAIPTFVRARILPNANTPTIYAWGAQLTQTSTAVPYLPTDSVAIPSGFLGLETGEVWTLNGNAKIYQGLWDATGPSSLLIEEVRTNVFLNSTAPVTQSFTTSATPYTLSFYGSGAITLSGSYVAVVAGTDAYTRKTLTFTPTSASLTMTVTGTITSPQLEAGSFATSPIVTAGAQVTRTADQASMTGTNFSSWYNQAQGSFYANFQGGRCTGGNDYRTGPVCFNENSTYLGIALAGTTNTFNTWFNGSATSLTVPSADFVNLGGIAMTSYSSLGVINAASGVVNSINSAVLFPNTLTSLNIGSRGGSTSQINGHIRKLNYYATALPSAVLQSLTS